MQFRMAQVRKDPLLVCNPPKEDVRTLGWRVLQTLEIAAETSEPFVEREHLKSDRPAGQFGNSPAGIHGFIDEPLLHRRSIRRMKKGTWNGTPS